uniref:Uncharacterized protein n=1 Tax=Acrobeloides nanus TaxID=290746 RepID=A0A914DWG2_9BILA
MDDIDREQKKERLESDTRNKRQEGEIWNTFEAPDPHKEEPANWKEVSDAADKGFGYAKGGRGMPSHNE